MVATLIIAGSLFTSTVHAQTAPHPVVTTAAVPTIVSQNITPGGVGTSTYRYTVSFKVNVTAVNGPIKLGLPVYGDYAAFSTSTRSVILFMNLATSTTLKYFNPSVSYTMPIGASSSSAYDFIIPQNVTVTIPVTYTFTIVGPGANNFGLSLVGINYIVPPFAGYSPSQLGVITGICTVNAICGTPANPIVPPLMSLSPNSVVSGGTSVMSFVIPSDALRAPLTIVCPPGLTATVVNPTYDLCSGKPFYIPANNSQYTVKFTNSTPLAITINPSVTITYTDHAGESRTASALITVVPISKQISSSVFNIGFKNVAANTIDAAAGFLSALRGMIFGN